MLALFQHVVELKHCDAEAVPDLTGRTRALIQRFEERLAKTAGSTPLAKAMRAHRLDAVERHVLLALALLALGMVQREARGAVSIGEIQSVLGLTGSRAFDLARRLASGSRLVRGGLVEVDEGDVMDCRDVTVAPDFLERLLGVTQETVDSGWRVRSHEELIDRCHPLILGLVERGSEVMLAMPGRREERCVARLTRSIERLTWELQETLERHADWPLGRLTKSHHLSSEELHVFLVVLGWELGFGPSDEVVTGEGLARCISRRPVHARRAIRLLRSEARLRKAGLIQPAGSLLPGVGVEDDGHLLGLAFELSEEALTQLGVGTRRRGRFRARAPLMRREQLVLPPEVDRALNLAIAQSRHARVLFEEWGVGGTVTYGRGTTLLFSGPPGVGKTAAAEALAHELCRDILVASYAEVQNAYIGQTEKNIVRIFHQARQADAVLFWDEADAMFSARQGLRWQHEIRDVNVLLQELERFDGTCILATNRRAALDPALARRVTLKVEFEEPDERMRRMLWRKLLPPSLPLAEDVDLAVLATTAMTGGEIKNAVLNAARGALMRGADARVTQDDLVRAVGMELERTPTAGKHRLGFA